MLESLDKLRLLLGPFPDSVALDAIVLEQVDCGSYIREKVEYTVERDERVRAYVCVPKTGYLPVPAVFCHHQHASNFDLGKSETVGLIGDPNQAVAAELAERGFITFAPDAIAFEERNWSEEPGRAEYFELASRLVVGQTLLAKALHDVSTGLNYLCNRPEVDPSRIGFIGHSYGGRMAIWASAFDKRIRASVSHCGCIDYAHSLSRDVGIQMEFCVPGIAKTIDIGDVCAIASPRALLLSATTDDVWSRGAKETYTRAKAQFEGDSLELKIWDGGHIFTGEMREFAYNFLDRYLDHNPAIAPPGEYWGQTGA
ncbi:MAG: dienelactone hydrolase family protein [Candidatus Cybelea sp.]